MRAAWRGGTREFMRERLCGWRWTNGACDIRSSSSSVQYSQQSELDNETLEFLWMAEHAARAREQRTELRLNPDAFEFADPHYEWRLPYQKPAAPVSVPQRGRCQEPLAAFLIRLLCALARAVPALGAMGDTVLLQCVGVEVLGRLHPRAAGLAWKAILKPNSPVLEAVATDAFAGLARLGRDKFLAWHGAVRALDNYTFVDALARAYNDAVPYLLNCGAHLVLDECVLDRKSFTRNIAKKPGQKGIEFITAATGVHGSGGSATWFVLPHV